MFRQSVLLDEGYDLLKPKLVGGVKGAEVFTVDVQYGDDPAMFATRSDSSSSRLRTCLYIIWYFSVFMSDVFLECFSWITVGKQYSSAMRETMLVQYVVHDHIVLMGVYPQR